MKRILIAGIGNIFFGDDAFGCEVVKLLQKESLPDSIKLVDFGIRTRDLAYELCENYDFVILIDAVKLGNPGVEISLIEINPNDLTRQNSFVSHEAKLEEILNFAQNLGANLPKILLIGYEAQNFEFNAEKSPNFNQAVKEAVEKTEKLLDKFCLT